MVSVISLHKLTSKFPLPDLVDRGENAEQDTHSSQNGADGGDDNCECEHRSQTFQRVVFVPIWKRKNTMSLLFSCLGI